VDGSPIIIPLSIAGRAVADVPSGIYQLGVIGASSSGFEGIAIERYPNTPTDIQRVPALTQNGSGVVHTGPVVAVNEAPGPRRITTLNGTAVSLMPADLLGSAYTSDGPTQITIDHEPQIERAGIVISLVAILLIGLMAAGVAVPTPGIVRIARRTK
jgi:hypothetical protein